MASVGSEQIREDSSSRSGDNYAQAQQSSQQTLHASGESGRQKRQLDQTEDCSPAPKSIKYEGDLSSTVCTHDESTAVERNDSPSTPVVSAVGVRLPWCGGDGQETSADSHNYGYKVLVKCGVEVTEGLSRNPKSAASFLHSRGFISDRLLEEIVELTHMTKSDNGQKLYTAVLSVVKSFPRRYAEFISVLEESGHYLNSDLLTLLRGTYRELDQSTRIQDQETSQCQDQPQLQNTASSLCVQISPKNSQTLPTAIATDHTADSKCAKEESENSTISAIEPQVSDLKTQIDILETKFGVLTNEALERLESTGVSLGTFYGKVSRMKHTLGGLAGPYFHECFDKVASFLSLAIFWGKLNRFWDFYNFELFQHVVRVMFPEGDPLLSKLAVYEDNISRFLSSTKLCIFFKVWPFSIPKPQKKDIGQLKTVVVEVDLNWEECTLQDVKNISDAFAQGFFLSREFMLLAGVSPGSVLILWYTPPSIVSSIMAQIKTKVVFLVRNCFLSVALDDYRFFTPDTMKQLFLHLQTIYTTSFKPVKMSRRKPFKLALISSHEVFEQYPDLFTKESMRGDKDDIRYRKSPIDRCTLGYLPDSSTAQLVLVEGLPGSGKTTFSREFSLNWAVGSAFSDSILILLPLRDYNVRKVTNLQELLTFIKPGDESLEQELETSKGEGLTFWLDGWDEIVSTLKGKSIYKCLVTGEILPRARVIVSSRHWATTFIKEQLDIQPSQHIEIVSSFQDQLSWLTDLEQQASHSKFPSLIDSFVNYLKETPAIQCNMHTPLATDITFQVYESLKSSVESLPTTTTQLYSSYTRLCVYKYLDNNFHFSSKLWKSDNLGDLPAPLNCWFMSLCRLAFDGLLDGQRLVFPNVPSHLRLETLELMQAQDPLYGSEESVVVSYHYNHLTLQEFLCAFLLSCMGDQERSESVQELLRAHGQFTMVLRFLSGLIKSCPVPREDIMTMFDSEDQRSTFHWLYEAGDASIADILAEGVRRVRADYSWSCLDYYVCAYCIAHSECHWNIACTTTFMSDEKMTQFLKALNYACVEHKNASIQVLDFRGNGLTSQSLCHLPDISASLLSSLKNFNISSNNLDSTAVDYIAKTIPHMPQLEKLDLSRNPGIQRGGVVSLAIALHDHKALKVLQLWRTNIGQEDCEQLAQLLSCNQCLEELNVNSNSLSPGSIHILLQGLQQSKSLRELYLHGNQISASGMKVFSDYLQQKYCTLSCVNLSNCSISQEAAVELAEGLKQNSSLETLLLWGNKIGSKGAYHLSRAIAENNTLKKLDISSDDSLSQIDVDTLRNGRANNRTLKELMLPKKF